MRRAFPSRLLGETGYVLALCDAIEKSVYVHAWTVTFPFDSRRIQLTSVIYTLHLIPRSNLELNAAIGRATNCHVSSVNCGDKEVDSSAGTGNR
jgi:hypothetical protein